MGFGIDLSLGDVSFADSLSPAVSNPVVPVGQRFGRPVAFVRQDLKTNLWSKQAEILRAIKKSKRVAVRSCNGSGKTFVAATAVIWWLLAHADTSAMVVTTAPTQHQVRDLLWREIRSLYFRNAALIGGEIGRTTLELGPRHYATGLSTDSPERFQGFHETNILFVVDEASGVREEVFEAIEGSMTSRRVRLLLIGNPTSLSGTFYKAFHQRRTQYKTIHISAFDTPNVSAGRTSVLGRIYPPPNPLPKEGGPDSSIKRITVPGIVTPDWIDDAAQTWGTNSAQYQVRVLGEFPTQANDTLIPLTQIEQAIGDQSGSAPDHQVVDLAAPVEIGVDVARFGTDRTVICVRQGSHVIAINQHQKLDTMQTTGLVVKAINDYNPKSVRIDEIGIGAGVLDRLHELGHNQVEGINVGNKATDPEHFFNLRSELYDNLRARFEERTIVIPNDEDLIGQLASLRVEYTSRGQLKVEAKETMRRRSLPSPDKADALMLAFAPEKPRSNFQIWTGPPER